MLKEFKEFAFRGNVIDLAIGVVMGAAFNAIVSSLVADIFMPIIGIITGGRDFSGLSYTVGDSISQNSTIDRLPARANCAFRLPGL